MIKKAKRESAFATPTQTKKWIKCVNSWAQANNKSPADICALLGFANRSSWHRLLHGTVKRVKLSVLMMTVKTAGLDLDYINGIYNYKYKFSESRNIFSDFKASYRAHITAGHYYSAAQIIRKAAIFIFETLIPNDLQLTLTMENASNLYEAACVRCDFDNVSYTIGVFGDQLCVKFRMSKKTLNKGIASNVDIPIMEGDLDMHGSTAIKKVIMRERKNHVRNVTTSKIFENNARRISNI